MTAEAAYIQLVNGACQYSKADSLSRVVAQLEEMPNFNSDPLDSFSCPRCRIDCFIVLGSSVIELFL